jgi:hypothetical protein
METTETKLSSVKSLVSEFEMNPTRFMTFLGHLLFLGVTFTIVNPLSSLHDRLHSDECKTIGDCFSFKSLGSYLTAQVLRLNRAAVLDNDGTEEMLFDCILTTL